MGDDGVGAMGSRPFDPGALELKRQQRWRARDAHGVVPRAEGKGVYVYVPAPFTSGRLHLGHVRSHAMADAYARFRRAQGKDVLFSIGFDAFGLPAELEAVRRDLPIAAWVARCVDAMRAQMDRLGFSIAWERAFVTSDDLIYRWSQRMFHLLYEAGLVYRAKTSIDWCDSCATVLAPMHVEGDACWRCGTPVRIVEREQWYVNVQPYVAENEQRLAGWAPQDQMWVASQHEVIGRVAGVELDARAADGRSLTVFTPHAEHVADSRFVAISPRHPDVHAWADEQIVRDLLEQVRREGWRRDERDAEKAPLALTGHELRLPELSRALPLVVSPMVDARFGPTAVLGIPTAERGDAIVAERLGLPVAGQVSATAAPVGSPATRHRAYDIAISRQRAWGAPIPIVHCDDCGMVPVPLAELPVRLPAGLRTTATDSSLASDPDFVDVACPGCRRPARRETDTIDCHFDAMWLWIPSAVTPEGRAEAMFDDPELRRWLPAEMVVWGADGGRYMFDQRMIGKSVRDLRVMPWLGDGEPFEHVAMHEMVRTNGQKMSKHLGNSVDPAEIVEAAGADALRLAMLVSAAPRKPLAWSADNLRRGSDFLAELWELAAPRLRRAAEQFGEEELAGQLAFDTGDPLRARLARWCDAAMRRVTEDVETMELHKATDNVLQLAKRIRQFEARAIERRGSLDEQDERAVAWALLVLVRLLFPFAPHISEELWELGCGEGTPCTWPSPRREQQPVG
jgi:leucyl-tRNA synthetase